MLVSTFIKTMDQANSLSYSIILANIFIMCVFISTSGTLKLLYSDDMLKYAYIRGTTFFLELFPTFCFSLSYGLITYKASKYFDYGSLDWEDGQHFGWEETKVNIDMSGEISG